MATPEQKTTPAQSQPVDPVVKSESKPHQQVVDDIEKELELDLENMKIDENIDTSVSVVHLSDVYLSLLIT